MTRLDEFIDRLDSITTGARDGFNEVQDAMDGPTLRHDDAPGRLDFEDDAAYYEACLDVARQQLRHATETLWAVANDLDDAADAFPEAWDVRPEARDDFDDRLGDVFEAVESVARWRDEIERFEAAYRGEQS